jgi:uncharacterized protein
VANDAQSSANLAESVRKFSRKEQTLELGVFLFLIVPSLILSQFVAGQWTHGFAITAAVIILRDLPLAGLVLFFVWRNAEPFRAIGWTSQFWVRQIGLGVLLFPLMFLSAMLVAWLLMGMGFSSPNSALRSALLVRSWSQVPLAVLMVVVVAVTEETIFRGYLLLRLKALGGSEFFAVVLSTLIFTMGHSYQGVAGLGAVALMGVVFALIYLRTGSLVAPVVMHFLQDFLGVVVAPLLKESMQ